MDTKRLKSRRTTQETWPHPVSPNEEALDNCNGNHENITVTDNCGPGLTKATRTGLLQPALKGGRRFPKNKTLISGPETALTEQEPITIGSVCNNLNSLNLSSADSQNLNNFQQKRPVKLAPLELPAQVKETQKKKITSMADKVYVSERKPSHRNISTPYQCPTKNELLKKVRMWENKLPKLPEEMISTKDNVLVKDSSLTTPSLPRDRLLGGSNVSMMKTERRTISDSMPKAISSNINESQNTSVQRQFRSTRCPNTYQGSNQAFKINGPAGDYVEMKTIGKLGY